MDNLNFFLKYSLLFLILMIFLSCEEDFQDFPTISYNPCEIEDVSINPNFITDFECQSNFILNNVETVRNPSETPLNTSNFVGLYTTELKFKGKDYLIMSRSFFSRCLLF